jgi:hypothetical protein
MFTGLRLALILGSIAIFYTVGLAQDDERDVHIGLKAGVSLPNLRGGSDQEITKDYKSRTTANFGGFVDVGLSRNVSLQFEVDYAPQGGKRNGIQPVTQTIPGLPPLPPGRYYYANFNNTAKLNYLEFPVMLKYRARKDKRVGFYVNGGPYFGYLLKATTVTAGSARCISITKAPCRSRASRRYLLMPKRTSPTISTAGMSASPAAAG